MDWRYETPCIFWNHFKKVLKRHGCKHQLRVTEIVYDKLNQSKSAVMLLFHARQAFDRVRNIFLTYLIHLVKYLFSDSEFHVWFGETLSAPVEHLLECRKGQHWKGFSVSSSMTFQLMTLMHCNRNKSEAICFSKRIKKSLPPKNSVIGEAVNIEKYRQVLRL